MSAAHQLITDHLDIWTAADTEKKSGRGRASGNANSVYGIKKLRELILELAVRGKLVPQDPNDEPASELLKRIQNEKAKLTAEGTIKKEKTYKQISETDLNYTKPSGWEFVSISKITVLITDGTHHTPKYQDHGVPFISVKDINGKTVSFDDCKYITQEEHEQINLRCNPERGDILLCRIGTLGRATIVDTDKAFSLFVSVGLLKMPKSVDFAKFMHLTLSSPLLNSQFDTIKAGGSHTNKLNLGEIPRLAIPLPPLAEQHRIVAKVDELMALCDQLEAQHNNAADAHEQLVSHLLSTLTQSQDAADFNANWQRIATHFDTLFTTESSIDALKQTLLQLAVMGKLVPQDPNDEPASELLKRIQAEKAKLVKDGKNKKEKSFSKIAEDEKLFELPSNWQWVRFGEVNTIRSELVRPEDFLEFRQVAPDCIEKGTGQITEIRTVAESGVKGPNSRFYKGQIVYSKIRPSLSKAVLVDFDGLCSADMYPIETNIIPSFLLKQILSECFLAQVRVAENRIKMPKLNMESLTEFILAIPPLEEQHRIVTKIDELMTLCVQLKSRITGAKQLQQKLADVLVENAL